MGTATEDDNYKEDENKLKKVVDKIISQSYHLKVASDERKDRKRQRKQMNIDN